MEHVQLSLAEVSALGERCLRRNGCDSDNARAVSETMTLAERDACHSHGLFRLPGYVSSLRSGKVNGKAEPRLEELAPSALRVDGDRGYASLALQRGLPPFIECASQQGIATLALVNIFHFAALWVELEAIAVKNLAALAFVGATAMVAPAGAQKAFFGTNPLGFAWPRPGREPMVFDQATAAMARGEIQIAARDKRPVPLGTGLDAQGLPTTDAAAIINGGVQLPFGGYKGSSLSLMVELLSAGLLGEQFGAEASHALPKDGGPNRGGQLIIAFNPEKFGNAGAWVEHCEQFFGELLSLDGVRLPGDRRLAQRELSVRDGVEIPEPLYREILALEKE